MLQSVLVVDDSSTTRAVIRKTLALAGIKPTEFYEARDGMEALQILETHSVDLVFADLNMPRMGGDELIARMSTNEQLRDVPVVIVSTEGSKTRLDEILRPAVTAFIRKPFTPEQLREVALSVLQSIS